MQSRIRFLVAHNSLDVVTQMQVPHTLTTLAQGVIPLVHRDLGKCEVRRVSPNLWAIVAEDMGFNVAHMICPDSVFPTLIKRYGVGGSFTHGKPRKFMPRTLKCVFLDRESLAGTGDSYLKIWLCLHVFPA